MKGSEVVFHCFNSGCKGKVSFLGDPDTLSELLAGRVWICILCGNIQMAKLPSLPESRLADPQP